MKNPTPRQIALGASAFMGFASIIILLGTGLFSGHQISWPLLILLPVLFFILSYLIYYYALEIFIYRKIKLIYKVITKAKTTKVKASSSIDMNKDIIADVEKEVMESAIAENEEIEQLRRMEEYRRQFLGNVSHELKTPIFHVQGYIETLLDGGINDDNINIKYLKKASQNIDRLNTIITDLEMISLIEDGKLNLDIEDFNFWELVNDVFDSLSLLASQNEIELKFKKGFLNPCYVSADKEQIHQVLVNLLTNSIKYNHAGGKVTIGTYDMDKKYLIEVTDNGIGIEEEYLPRIFERFFRVSKSRSREKGGTGLGLSIVKHILEAHGQTIKVRSTPGMGTTFGFTLDKAILANNQGQML